MLLQKLFSSRRSAILTGANRNKTIPALRRVLTFLTAVADDFSKLEQENFVDFKKLRIILPLSLSLLLAGLSAMAAIAPPFTVKFFGSSTIGTGGSTTLDITVNNTGTVDYSGVTFTDNFPAGLAVSTPNGLLSACTPGSTLGAITAVAGSGTVSLAASSILASGACTVQVNVTGGTAGAKVNSVTASDTTAGAGNTATATVTVLPTLPASISKQFGVATIGVGGTTSLTLTVTNPNASAMSSVNFTDTLPAGLVVSTPSILATTCASGTAFAATGGSTVSLTGAALAANSSCTITVNVTAVSSGLNNNSVTVSSANEGVGNTATASINVLVPPSISKSFGPSTITFGSFSALTFTLTNSNSQALTGVAFTDTLPAGLSVAVDSVAKCGGTLLTAQPGTIVLSGATIPANSTCQFVVGVHADQTGTFVNTTGAITATNGGTGNIATASLIATPRLAIPTLANWALALLSLLLVLAALGYRRIRR